ncbi:MAG: hypothetical protein WAP03_12225 [Methylorubrum rhodinum]|uniref:hypothetical protein n=1 Tax=Methylorubrum rhodinum TaxID=29428 RepID=UPI003BAE735A
MSDHAGLDRDREPVGDRPLDADADIGPRGDVPAIVDGHRGRAAEAQPLVRRPCRRAGRCRSADLHLKRAGAIARVAGFLEPRRMAEPFDGLRMRA